MPNPAQMLSLFSVSQRHLEETQLPLLIDLQLVFPGIQILLLHLYEEVAVSSDLDPDDFVIPRVG